MSQKNKALNSVSFEQVCSVANVHSVLNFNQFYSFNFIFMYQNPRWWQFNAELVSEQQSINKWVMYFFLYAVSGKDKCHGMRAQWSSHAMTASLQEVLS